MPVCRASDIMIRIEDYPTVSPDVTLGEAIEAMEDSAYDIACANGRKSLPRVLLVVDPVEGLSGMVRRRDILRGLHPSFEATTPEDAERRVFPVTSDPNLSELAHDHLLRQMRARAARTVREVMIPIVATVDAGDHLFKLIRELVGCNTSLLPVLSGERVVGVVRSVDVLHEVCGMISDVPEGA